MALLFLYLFSFFILEYSKIIQTTVRVVYGFETRLTLIPGCLRSGLSWFNWLVSFAPEFQCCCLCESSCLFYLSFNLDVYVSKIIHL